MSKGRIRILVDLLALGYGGSETYAREVLPRMAGGSNEIAVLLAAGTGEKLRSSLGPHIKIIDAPQRVRNPFRRHFYQRHTLPKLIREMGIDVLFVPGGQTGTRKGPNDSFKLTSMLRNMLPFDERERARFSYWNYPWVRLRLELLASSLIKSFRASDRIIFISEYSRSVVQPRCPGVDFRIIPHGIKPMDSGTVGGLEKFGIATPYFCYLSILDPYKHQDKVIEGFQKWQQRSTTANVELVLAGPPAGTFGERIIQQARRAENSVRYIGPVTPADIPALLRHAKILLFASTCETCPNILLEYLSAGRPILCSKTPPMPEFGGDAVRYVDAEDPAAWATALDSLISDTDAQSGLSQRAKERSALYSWDDTARRTLAALTEWDNAAQSAVSGHVLERSARHS